MNIFFVDAFGPQIMRLVNVSIGRDHQIFVGIIGARRMVPSLGSRSICAPQVFFVNFVGKLFRHHTLPFNLQLATGPARRAGRRHAVL